MSNDQYAPPTVEATDDRPNEPPSTEAPYFLVSPLKLLLLNFGTLGFYQYYWFYKNWRHHELRTGEDVSPFWRTLFALIFCYPLFRRIDDYAASRSAPRLTPGPWAAAWIIPSVLWNLPDPYWLIIYLAVFALLPVQAQVNQINAGSVPEHDRNERIRGWNWVAVLIGLPLFGLVVYGTFYPAG